MKQHKVILYRISLLILIILTTVAVSDCPNLIKYQYLVTSVIDGDTIQLENGEVIRYIGADTPETVHPTKPVECFGPEATAFNTELVDRQFVYLHYDEDRLDRYGRILAYVHLTDGTFVNAELIRHGYARFAEFPPNTEYSEHFADLQAKAQKAKRGLWGKCVDEVEEEEQEEKTFTFDYDDLNGNGQRDPGEQWHIVMLPDKTESCVKLGHIEYDPPGQEPDDEIIELKNNCVGTIDIGGWRLSDGEGSYRIPFGETIAPHSTWKVYGRQYNPNRNKRGLYLNNTNDCVKLYNPNDKLVDSRCW